MAQLDFSAVLSNPVLLSGFSVIRRATTVNYYGEVCTTPQTIGPLRGVVYPAGANDLKRLPEAQYADKGIVVICRYALRTASVDNAGNNTNADIVNWHGSNYLVQALEDWSEYGRGYVNAVCVSMTTVDPPPVTSLDPVYVPPQPTLLPGPEGGS